MHAPCRIGWSTADITPEKTVLVMGQFHARVSEKITTPLSATIMAVEYVADGPSRHLLDISCDLALISDSLKYRVRAAIVQLLPHIKPASIILHATHTHSAPDVRQREDIDGMGGGHLPPIECMEGIELPVQKTAEYVDGIVQKIAAAAKAAWDSREVSGIAYGLGFAVVGYNRRVCYLDGSCKMYGETNDPQFSHIEGHEDHTVNVLATYNHAGRMTGLIINLACPSQVNESLFGISGDFWHDARAELRKRFDPKLPILVQCSAAGDQSPHMTINKAAHERMFRLHGRNERQDIALRIANAVEEVLPVIEKEIDWEPVFDHRVQVLELKRRNLTEQDVVEANAEAEKHRVEHERIKAELEAHPEKCKEPRWYVSITSIYRVMKWHAGVAERFQRQQTEPTIAQEVHVFRLGDVAFSTSPFEYFLDYGQRIKARSRAIQTFVIQLAGMGTYLPTYRAMANKSYGAGAASTPIGPEGGEQIVEASLAMIDEVF